MILKSQNSCNSNYVVVGLGKTGISCVRYLISEGYQSIQVMDTRSFPPELSEFKSEFPKVELYLGGFNQSWLDGAYEIVISPGVSLLEKSIVQASKKGVNIIGDIELFSRSAKAPIIAITGSNGKSTVTTLLGSMAEKSGLIVGVGGNIGMPALSLLSIPNVELYILELSSFQLETIQSLRTIAVAILNITPDHLDRHGTFENYKKTKHLIYNRSDCLVYNRDDLFTHPKNNELVGVYSIGFSIKKPKKENEFGLDMEGQTVWLMKGATRLLNLSTIMLQGKYNYLNIMAALALGERAGLSMQSMLATFKTFKGLPHRCELVANYQGVLWINDSKATNVGATVAAIESYQDKSIIVILGGDGKNADFTPLKEVIKQYVKKIILIGRDANRLNDLLAHLVCCSIVDNLSEAVRVAKDISQSGDVVLLSPACASLDMFKNFEQRGDEFKIQVSQILNLR